MPDKMTIDFNSVGSMHRILSLASPYAGPMDVRLAPMPGGMLQTVRDFGCESYGKEEVERLVAGRMFYNIDPWVRMSVSYDERGVRTHSFGHTEELLLDPSYRDEILSAVPVTLFNTNFRPEPVVDPDTVMPVAVDIRQAVDNVAPDVSNMVNGLLDIPLLVSGKKVGQPLYVMSDIQARFDDEATLTAGVEIDMDRKIAAPHLEIDGDVPDELIEALRLLWEQDRAMTAASLPGSGDGIELT